MDDNTLSITGHSLSVCFQFPGCVISNQIKSKGFGLAVIAGLTNVRIAHTVPLPFNIADPPTPRPRGSRAPGGECGRIGGEVGKIKKKVV